MKQKVLVGVLSASLLSVAALTPAAALAESGDSICSREARTFNEWVVQIFTCR